MAADEQIIRPPRGDMPLKAIQRPVAVYQAIAADAAGTIDELMGDAILILLGAPRATDDADHALRAVLMAVQMQAAVEQLNAKWGADGIDEIFRVRMGINTGVATIGNFGSSGRMKYAALGKHANLAARLQAMCEPGKVLISHSARLLVHDQIPRQQKGETTLEGIQRPVMTDEVLRWTRRRDREGPPAFVFII